MPKWLQNLYLAAEGEGGGGGAPTPDSSTPTPEPAAPEPKPEGEALVTGETDGPGSLVPEEKPEGESEPKPIEAKPEPLDLTKLKLPEGLTSDDPGLAKLVEVLGNDKLSPAQRIESLTQMHADVLKDMATQASAAATQRYTDLNTAWVKEIKSDPDLGGDKLDATLGVIAKGINSWSPDATAFKAALALTGAGNNPHVIRTLYKMCSALAEGKPAQGAQAAGTKTASQLFYGDSAPAGA